MKKLTAGDWDAIQKRRPARRYIQSVEDGTVRVVFDSEILRTKKDEQDILGYVWDKDWNKIEAKCIINGSPKIYAMGGEDWGFFNEFIDICKANDIGPEDIPGSVFDVTKTGDWTQEFAYVGRDGSVSTTSKPKPIELKENLIQDTREIVADLKKNSPELAMLGWTKPDFFKILSIKSQSQIKSGDATRILPKLVEEGLLKVDNDKVSIL